MKEDRSKDKKKITDISVYRLKISPGVLTRKL